MKLLPCWRNVMPLLRKYDRMEQRCTKNSWLVFGFVFVLSERFSRELKSSCGLQDDVSIALEFMDDRNAWARTYGALWHLTYHRSLFFGFLYIILFTRQEGSQGWSSGSVTSAHIVCVSFTRQLHIHGDFWASTYPSSRGTSWIYSTWRIRMDSWF